jgi:phthiocerol/phenolphthiocerol synthesis type-I polyketide synthase E
LEKEKTVGTNTGTGASHQKFITTGPRWNVLKKVYVGEGQSLAELELDERFSEDLEHYPLHPAVLDVATGFIHFLTEGDYLPLTYERITIWGRFPQKVFSYLRLRNDLKKSGDVITSDISILDEEGWELVRMDGFSMRRVSKEAIARLQKPASVGDIKEKRLLHEFKMGMSATQGVEAFQRILAGATSPQVIVCARDLHAAMQETAALNRSRILAELESSGPQQPVQPRPDLSSTYEEPADNLEQRIARIWQRVLGVERVGIYDNFFELGGTSLNGVQLVAALKKELNVDVPMVSIFEAPTVAALANYLRPGSEQPIFERVQSRAERKKQALEMNQRTRAGVVGGR